MADAKYLFQECVTADEVHNELRYLLVCDFLQSEADERKFRLKCQSASRLIEGSNVEDILNILERLGKFGVGNYDFIKQKVKDINDKILKLIDQADRRIKEIKENSLPVLTHVTNVDPDILKQKTRETVDNILFTVYGKLMCKEYDHDEDFNSLLERYEKLDDLTEEFLVIWDQTFCKCRKQHGQQLLLNNIRKGADRLEQGTEKFDSFQRTMVPNLLRTLKRSANITVHTYKDCGATSVSVHKASVLCYWKFDSVINLDKLWKKYTEEGLHTELQDCFNTKEALCILNITKISLMTTIQESDYLKYRQMLVKTSSLTMKEMLYEINNRLSRTPLIHAYLMRSHETRRIEPFFNPKIELMYSPVSLREYKEPILLSRLSHIISDRTDNLFVCSNETSSFVFILGEAGCGKTTYCFKLLSLWCDAQLRKEVSSADLGQFDYVFYISSSVSPRSKESLGDLIIKVAFGKLTNYQQEANKVLRDESKKCLVLMDDFHNFKDYLSQNIDDEISDLANSYLNCVFVFTMRPTDLFKTFSPDTFHMMNIRVLQLSGIDESWIPSFYGDKMFSNAQRKRDQRELTSRVHIQEAPAGFSVMESSDFEQSKQESGSYFIKKQLDSERKIKEPDVVQEIKEAEPVHREKEPDPEHRIKKSDDEHRIEECDVEHEMEESDPEHRLHDLDPQLRIEDIDAKEKEKPLFLGELHIEIKAKQNYPKQISKQTIPKYGEKEPDSSMMLRQLEAALEENYEAVMKIPILGIICLEMLIERKQVPRNHTGLYLSLIDALIRRYEMSLPDEQIIQLEPPLPKCLVTLQPYDSINRHLSTLYKLGNLAYDCMLNPKIYNDIQIYEKYLGKDRLTFALNSWILVGHSSSTVPGEQNHLQFLHNLVRDCLVAVYLTENMDIFDKFCRRVNSFDIISDLSSVIMTVCGVSPNLASQLSGHIKGVIDKEESVVTYRNFQPILVDPSIKEFYKQQLSWYLEFRKTMSEISDELSLIFNISDIYLDDESDKRIVDGTLHLLSDENVRAMSVHIDDTQTESRIDYQIVINFLANNLSLVSLFIRGSDTKRPVDALSIPFLKTLYLANCQIKHAIDDDEADTPLFLNVPKVQTLYLYDIQLNNRLLGLTSDEGKLPKLKSLDIYRLDMGNQSITLARDMTELESINFDHVYMSALGWMAFVKSLIKIQHSFRILLNQTDIDAQSKKMIRSDSSFAVEFDSEESILFKRSIRA